MGQKVLIIGASGTGKSTSLRNFGSDEVCLVKTVSKPLPFRGKFTETFKTDKVTEIISKMKSTDKKVIVVDDGQYIMGNEYFRRANEQGWQKFTDIGKNFFDVLDEVEELPDDVIVYFLLHTEKDADGNIKIKTIGKMLDEKLTIEGLATVVLMTNVTDGVYTFQTQNSGHDICKSPMGMFENYLIDNDLKMVDGIIREYYGLSDVKPEEKGVAAEKPTRASRRAARTEPVKTEEKIETADVRPTRARRVRNTEKVEDAPPAPQDLAEEAAAESLEANAYGEQAEEPKRMTLAEKMAASGYASEEQPTPTRRRRG